MSLKTIKLDILKILWQLEIPKRTSEEKGRFAAPGMLGNFCNIVLQVKN